MRRTAIALLALVVAVACARTEQPETEAATGDAPAGSITLADLAGTWQGTVSPTDGGAAVATTELTATAGETGWTMNVASASDPSITSTTPLRVVAVEGDSVIVEAGPFPSVLRPGEQISTHSIYRLRDGRLVGTTHVTYPSGEMVMLLTEATRR